MDQEPLPERVFLLSTTAFYVPVIAAALGWLWLWRDALSRVLGDAPVRDLALGLAAGALVALFSRLSADVPVFRRMSDSFGRLLGPMSFGGCLLLAALSAVGEELVFRAALQPEVGWLWATVLFAVVHFPLERDLLLWPVFAFAVGLLLAALFAVTGAAVAPIAAHFAINAHNLWFVASRQR